MRDKVGREAFSSKMNLERKGGKQGQKKGALPVCSRVSAHSHYFGEGSGTPLQYSCLENPMEGGAWQAAVSGVAKSRTRLSDFTFTFHFHALERKWQPTPVFLPGESQGQGSLVGCRLWGHRESDTTEATQQQQQHTGSEGSVSAVRTQRSARYPSA